MSEFELLPAINRTALVVSAKQPFLDWIKSHASAEHAIDFSEFDQKTVYLLPVIESSEEYTQYLEKNYLKIFEDELGGWIQDTSLWPKDRSLQTFQAWCQFDFSSMVMDLGDELLDRD